MNLTITPRKLEPDIDVLELAGRITLGRDYGQVEAAVVGLLTAGARKIILDLSGATYVDSSGVGSIALSAGKAGQSKARLVAACGAGMVLEVFRMTRVDLLVPFFPMSLLPPPVSAANSMQVLQAGNHKFILLELDQATVVAIADQLGFVTRYQDHARHVLLDLTIENRDIPLLLFDAADPANLGWFSRCQFYIDGRTGQVLQTPMSIANRRDRANRNLPNSVRIRIAKELPASFRLPGRQALTEQVFYMMFNNFLQAIVKTGVAVCGGPAIQPLAGRTEAPGSRN